MKEKWVVICLLAVILILNWFGFIALDKKIDKAVDIQGKINESSYNTNKAQSESIRLLETDTQILMNITMNGIYCDEK